MADADDHGTSRPAADRSTPRWVKVFAAAALALLAAFVVVHLLGGGLHHHGLSRP